MMPTGIEGHAYEDEAHDHEGEQGCYEEGRVHRSVPKSSRAEGQDGECASWPAKRRSSLIDASLLMHFSVWSLLRAILLLLFLERMLDGVCCE
jgi:hypothetical protein